MIKVVAKISIRPSGSKVTSNAKYDKVDFQGEDENTPHFNHDHNHTNKFLDMKNNDPDPESLSIWNHPIYDINYSKNVLRKDHDLIDRVLLKQNHELVT